MGIFTRSARKREHIKLVKVLVEDGTAAQAAIIIRADGNLTFAPVEVVHVKSSPEWWEYQDDDGKTCYLRRDFDKDR